MAKLILIAVAVWLLVTIFKRYQASVDANKKRAENAPAQNATQDMVQCAHCGLHLPKAESIAKEGQHFCCEQHANL